MRELPSTCGAGAVRTWATPRAAAAHRHEARAVPAFAVATAIALTACGPPRDLASRLPYCALPAPCASDEECWNRYTIDLERPPTCREGLCVIEFRCANDEDCAGGDVCRFREVTHDRIPVEGVGSYECVPECWPDCPPPACSRDEDCASGDRCHPDGCLPETSCVWTGCPGARGCAHMGPGWYECHPLCGADRDCVPYGPFCPSGPSGVCIEGFCFGPPCIDGDLFFCGGVGGLVCRNTRPPPQL